MKTAIIAFTKNGAELAEKLCGGLLRQGNDVCAYAMPRHAVGTSLIPLEDTAEQWAGARFADSDAIIFVAACGIAVRSIAPYIKDKFTDPAVVAVDDRAGFAVSLLSGHAGGANALALAVAELCGARAVISTATDANAVFAVDTWAVRGGCYIADRDAAKKISAALLDGGEVGFAGDFPLTGKLPDGICGAKNGKLGFCVTLDEGKRPFECTLRLIPRVITLGLGCRKGASKRAIAEHVSAVCAAAGVSPHSIRQVCSIALKADEPGILEYCGEIGAPFITYTAEELEAVDGKFAASEFVKSVTGVDNVCERAAVCGSGGEILIGKQCGGGVTAALACDDWRISFD